MQPELCRYEALGAGAVAVVCWWFVFAGAQISSKDERKLEYALDAVRGPSPFEDIAELEPAVEAALLWQSKRSAQQVISERESMICSLERADALMRESGAAANWFNGCNAEIAKVCGVCVCVCGKCAPLVFARLVRA